MIKYSKYGNIKRTYKNIKFDSIKELGRYKELEILLKANKIKELEVHKTFLLLETQKKTNTNSLERAVKYISDFYYFDNELNIYVVEDVKSVATKKKESYIIKRKLFKFKYNHIKFLEV